MATEQGFLRIGELSRRTGVAPELLRAWERRYGLLRPSRSSGGFRLYSAADEQRIASMRENLRRGLAAAEAARLAAADADAPPAEETDRSVLDAAAERLRAALDAFDERSAQAALDELFGAFTLETVLGEVVLPYLAELGERWAAGQATVAQEHFASNVIRGRLLGLARGWDAGDGRRALLACAPGEQHDLGLIAFGLVLSRRGWRITFLGPDTPAESLGDAARALGPDVVVVAATASKRFGGLEDALRRLSRHAGVFLAGAGATPAVAERLGLEVLAADPVGAANAVAG